MPSFAITGWMFSRFGAASLLLIAACIKCLSLLFDPHQSVIWPFRSLWADLAIIVIEIFCSWHLLYGIAPQIGRYVAILLFCCFEIFTVLRILNGVEQCGCFGRADFNPWLMLLINSLALASLILFPPPKNINMPIRALRFALPLLLTPPMILAVLLATHRPDIPADEDELDRQTGVVILEPTGWKGRSCPILKYIDIKHDLRKGEWVIILFRADCQHCINVISKATQESKYESLVLVEVPPYASSELPLSEWNNVFVLARLNEAKDWFVVTPMAFRIKEGVVSDIISTE